MKSLLLQSICTAFLLIPVIVQGGYAGYVCPAGAKAGTECEVIIGGRGLQGIRTVIVDGDMSNRDVTVESVDIVPNGLYYLQKPEQKKYVDQWIRSLFNGTAAPELPEDTAGWNKSKNRK